MLSCDWDRKLPQRMLVLERLWCQYVLVLLFWFLCFGSSRLLRPPVVDRQKRASRKIGFSRRGAIDRLTKATAFRLGLVSDWGDIANWSQARWPRRSRSMPTAAPPVSQDVSAPESMWGQSRLGLR